MENKLEELKKVEIKISSDKYLHLIGGFLTALATFSYFKDIKKTISEKIALTAGIGFGVWALKEIFDCFVQGHLADIGDLLFSCAGVGLCLVWIKITSKQGRG